MQLTIPRGNPVLSLFTFMVVGTANLLAGASAFISAALRSLTISVARVETTALTVDEKRKIALEALIAQGARQYDSLRNVEYYSLEQIQGKTTRHTVLDPIVLVLRRSGVEMDRNIGAVLRELDVTKDDIHDLCWCHQNVHSRIDGRHAALILSGTFDRADKRSPTFADAA
jgi:hypothetical protein